MVAAITVATIAINTGSPAEPPRVSEATAEQAVNDLLAGIPQHGTVLGAPAAPVTLQWFGDLECPFCREFAVAALPSLIRRWVHSGQLQIDYRSMKTATPQKKVFEAQQVAALAAGEQNRMWNYIGVFYEEQRAEGSGYVNDAYLRNIALQVPNLNLELWSADRSNPALTAEVALDRRAVKNAHLHATPSFFIGRTRSRLLFRVPEFPPSDPSVLVAMIEKLLRPPGTGQS